MQIRCSQEELSTAISAAIRALPTRTTMPVLENVYLDASENKLTVICTDLSKGIETHIDADVAEEGSVLLPGRIFAEMVRKLPKGDVTLKTEGNRADIRCLSSHTRLSCQDASEYPDLPDAVSQHPIIMKQETLREMIRQTAFAASVDETRLILTGVLMEVTGDNVCMVALDGFRLAMRREKLGDAYDNISAVVPANAMGEIGKLLAGGDEKVSITLTDTHIAVEMGSTRFTARLLEGKFIKYTQILPSEWQSRAKVSCAEFSEALDRASTLAREGKNNLIRLAMSQGRMTLYADSDYGQAEESISVELEGKDLEIAFNARYITDVLKNVSEEDVYLCFNTNISPCVLRPTEEGEDFLFLVLPVRIYA